MNSCSIVQDIDRLIYVFTSSNNNYNALIKSIIDDNEEGYFYDINTIADQLNNELNTGLEEGQVAPFSKSAFINKFINRLQYSKISTKNDFFDKPLSTLYKGGSDSLTYMLNDFESNLVKCSFIDPESDEFITLDNSSLNKKVQNYKNSLFESLYNYLKNHPDFKSEYKDIKYNQLYINKRFNPESNYNKILEDIATSFKDYSTRVSVNNDKQLEKLKIYNAAVALSNFDDIIEDKFRSLIKVNQLNKNSLNTPVDTFQYNLEFKGATTEYWRKDGHAADGIENYASNIVKMIAGTIPLLDLYGNVQDNQFLGMERIYDIAAQIKYINNSPDISWNYHSSPQKNLRPALEKLLENKKLEKEASLLSLYTYLYGPNGIQELTYLAKQAHPEIANSIIDIEAIIAHQINNIIAPTYGSYSTDPKEEKVLLELIGRESKSDEIVDGIIKHIISSSKNFNRVEDSNGNIYINSQLLPETGHIESSMVKMVEDLTNVNITSKVTDALNKTLQKNLNQSLIDLLRGSKNILKYIKDNPKYDEKELRKFLTESAHVNSLLTAIIATINPGANMNFKDSKGNSIPTVKQSNMSHERKSVRKIAEKEFGSSKGLLFLENPGLFIAPETQLEVKTGDGKAVAAFYLNPTENFHLNFVENYINPMMSTKSGDYVSVKLVNFSDKSTILNDLIDQNLDIVFNGVSQGTLKNMSLESLKKLSNDSLKYYYEHLTDRIIDQYVRLLDKSGKPYIEFSNNRDEMVSKIDEFLDKHKSDFYSIYKSNWRRIEDMRQLDASITPLTFTKDVHYSSYGKKLEFNKVIYQYLKKTTEDSFNTTVEEEFLKKLITLNPNHTIKQILNLPGSKTGDYVTNLYKTLNITLGNWVKIENGIAKEFYYIRNKKTGDKFNSLNSIKIDNIYDYEINPLLLKFLHTQNLVRYGSLGLSTKHEYQHPHKIKGKSSSEITFLEEVSGRSVSMTKRMVIHPATMEYYMQDLPQGVPPTVKLAVVKDLQCISFNMHGDRKEHDAWDGSLAANPFLSFLLKKSFPGKTISDVQKAIGTDAKDTHSVFLKCALYTFTNEMIRISMGSPIDLNYLMKSINKIQIDSSYNLSIGSNGQQIDLDQLVPEGVYFKAGKTTFQIRSFEKVDGNNYKFNLNNVDTNESQSVVYAINNLYDLWQAFGGQFSMSPHGSEYVYSDASIEVVGNLIGLLTDENGNNYLKDKMIGIVAQESSVKNGATNINNTNDVFYKKFDENGNEILNDIMYSDFNTHFLGIQLDAYHVSDESVVNEISQVISALAENQATPELYSELYRAIGDIIKQEIKLYKDKYILPENGKYDVAKITSDFIKTLSAGDQIGNAKEIADILMELGRKNLPISNNNFFKSFVIDVLSKLSSQYIKRKYPGIAAVLNPSHGMIQVYEDINGDTYFYDDLLNMSDNEAFDLNIPIAERNKQIVNSILQLSKFNPEPMSANDIRPFSTIKVTYSDGREPEVHKLDDIYKYYNIKNILLNAGNTVTITKVLNVPRDLKPVDITYTQNGINTNIWDNDPERLTWSYKSMLDGGIKNESDIQILTNFANYWAKKDGMEISDILNKSVSGYILSKLKLWNQRSFELIANNFNYQKVSVDTDFDNLFGKDNFVSKLDLNYYSVDINGEKTFPYLEKIENYVHRPAEIILPKIYRSEFGIDANSFAKVKEQKEGFFKDQINQLLNFDTYKADILLSSKKGQLYVSVLSNDEILEKVNSGELEKVKLITKEVDGHIFRTDIKGDILYEISPYLNVYLQDGIEVVVFKKDKHYYNNLTNFLESVKSEYNFIYPMCSNIKEDFGKLLKVVNKISKLPLKSVNPNEDPYTEFTKLRNDFGDTLSKQMYASWLKSNEVIAARIPSQAMQSFMSMKCVGYNEDPGNNVFISHIQLWLQGSDYDIDKAYIMMSGFKNGLYRGWSPYFDNTSIEGIKISETLPIPNKTVYKVDESGVDVSDLVLGELNLSSISKILNRVKSDNAIKPLLDKALENKVLDIINRHNSYSYSTASIKNFVVKNIYETSNHPSNQIASYSPIDMGEYSDIKEQSDNSFTLSLFDGISMDQQQETNAIGKDVIGIAANGIKDYFALVEYFSNYYKDIPNKYDNEYFERSFDLGLGNVVINRISGLNLEQKAIDVLNQYISKDLGIDLKLNSKTDPALVLSSLLSAATDNAKELILKTINAGKEFAAMHIYLITIGFNEGDVARFMTSKENLTILNKLKHNIFTDSESKPLADNVVNEASTPQEFRKIYNLSKELTFLAKILKINQTLKASPDEVIRYFQGIEDEFVLRELQFLKDTSKVGANNISSLVNQYKSELSKEDVDGTKESKLNDLKISIINGMIDKIVTDKPYLNNSRQYIQSTLSNAIDYEIVSGGFSIEQFYKDEKYKNAAISYYNLIKGTFNILDVVSKLPHYDNVVIATKMSYDQIKLFSKKFNFVTEVIPEILKESSVSSVTYKVKGTNKISMTTDQINKGLGVFDDVVISKWLKNTFRVNPINLNDVSTLTDSIVYEFDVQEGVRNFVPISNSDSFIDFSDDVSLVNFKTMMEINILPYLKKVYPDNDFLKGLLIRSKSFTESNSRTWISTKIRMNKLTDPKNLDILFNYQEGLDSLDNLNAKIKFGETSYKISDLFFLYNLIVNKDQFGSDRLTKLFKNYITDQNSLAANLYDYYSKIDSGEIELFDESFPLDHSLRESIVYGVLNTRGVLNQTNDVNSMKWTLLNPNFTMITGIHGKISNSNNIKMFNPIMNLIQSKNLLIRFTCE